MDNLKFIETMSVADFKTKMGVDRIDVKQNPNTGKCFFVYGWDMFYMLHQQGDGGAPTLATL